MMHINKVSCKGRLKDIFDLGITPLSLSLSKVGGAPASKLLVWPDGGWLRSFSGLELGTACPSRLVITVEWHHVNPQGQSQQGKNPSFLQL